jgi:hypothetical protein
MVFEMDVSSSPRNGSNPLVADADSQSVFIKNDMLGIGQLFHDHPSYSHLLPPLPPPPSLCAVNDSSMSSTETSTSSSKLTHSSLMILYQQQQHQHQHQQVATTASTSRSLPPRNITTPTGSLILVSTGEANDLETEAVLETRAFYCESSISWDRFGARLTSPDRSSITGSVLDGTLDDDDDDDEGDDDFVDDHDYDRHTTMSTYENNTSTSTSNGVGLSRSILSPRLQYPSHHSIYRQPSDVYSPSRLSQPFRLSTSLLDTTHDSTTTEHGDQDAVLSSNFMLQSLQILSPSSSFVALSVEDDHDNEREMHVSSYSINDESLRNEADKNNTNIDGDSVEQPREAVDDLERLSIAKPKDKAKSPSSSLLPCCLQLNGNVKRDLTARASNETNPITDLAPDSKSKHGDDKKYTSSMTSNLQMSLLDRVTDRLMESFCHKPSTVLATPPRPCTRKATMVPSNSPTASSSVNCYELTWLDRGFPTDHSPIVSYNHPMAAGGTIEAYLQLVQLDMLALLECWDYPDENQMEDSMFRNQSSVFIRSTNKNFNGTAHSSQECEISGDQRPLPADNELHSQHHVARRHTLRERAFRLHRLRLERGLRSNNDRYLDMHHISFSQGDTVSPPETSLQPRPLSALPHTIVRSVDLMATTIPLPLMPQPQQRHRKSLSTGHCQRSTNVSRLTRPSVSSKAQKDQATMKPTNCTASTTFDEIVEGNIPRRRSRSVDDRYARLSRDYPNVRRGDSHLDSNRARVAATLNRQATLTSVLSYEYPLPSVSDLVQNMLNGLHSVESANNMDIGNSDSKFSRCESLDNDEDLHGYDSDPGDVLIRTPCTQDNTAQGSLEANPVSIRPNSRIPSTVGKDEPSASVNETMNMIWHVTWHPGAKTQSRRPLKVAIWIERGMMLDNSRVMLEPVIMWRESYQDKLLQNGRLNASTRKPYNLKILNVSRILEARSPTTLPRSSPTVATLPIIDRRLYPFARTSCSFFLRTGESREDYLFEASTPMERNDIVERWKMCIARFAALAVVEDMKRLTSEFFHPVVPLTGSRTKTKNAKSNVVIPVPS